MRWIKNIVGGYVNLYKIIFFFNLEVELYILIYKIGVKMLLSILNFGWIVKLCKILKMVIIND